MTDPRRAKALRTRKPTGRPAWPIILLAGAEKAGKTYAAAAASSSDLIDRTFWVGIGEDAPDEYGPLGRFEIVEHDGSYADIVRALTQASEIPTGKRGLPHMIVVDSMSMLWSMLSDEAQQIANKRRKRDEAAIAPDLWNRAERRWRAVMNILRAHQGPVVLTARLAHSLVMDGDKPTGERIWKVQGHKTLPFDATAVVQMRSRGDVYLTAVRSLRWTAPPEDEVPVSDFTVVGLWDQLGITTAQTRSHDHADGAHSLTAEDAMRSELLERLAASAPDMAAVSDWWERKHGHDIRETELLQDLLALTEKAEARSKATKEVTTDGDAN